MNDTGKYSTEQAAGAQRIETPGGDYALKWDDETQMGVNAHAALLSQFAKAGGLLDRLVREEATPREGRRVVRQRVGHRGLRGCGRALPLQGSDGRRPFRSAEPEEPWGNATSTRQPELARRHPP